MSLPQPPDHIEALTPYPPGKPIKELEREMGLSGVIKLASNENPFGPSPRAVEAACRAAAESHRYPDGSAYYLRTSLAEHLNQPSDRFVFGCGTNEIIDLTVRIFVGPGGKAVVPHPSFSIYSKLLQASGAETITVGLTKDNHLDLAAMAARVNETGARLVIVCNPNNPTGSGVKATDIADFAAGLPPETICLIDEAYIEFARTPGVETSLPLVDDDRPVIVSRTFSKLYGLAGLRVGYGVMSAKLADYFNRVRQPFNVTAPALAAAQAALEDRDWTGLILDRTWRGLDRLTQGLIDLGLPPGPTDANFLLFPSPFPADSIYRALLKRGVIARSMSSFGLDGHMRVSVGTDEENERFLSELERVMGDMESLK